MCYILINLVLQRLPLNVSNGCQKQKCKCKALTGCCKHPHLRKLLWHTDLEVWVIIYLESHRINSTLSVSMKNNFLTVMPVIVNFRA